ncbi:heparan sulfate glucosamine 3-O-sulfotransferase 5 [Elysia marginata]|uniref:Heparan sulfate glucosamine 3-O-sulfotransferase 5 n=1 Tax=Elysia marginata TaxID=1093978 RepID=A0AAV4K050_9GAST|nr:heparan sulfate glucosamine 3-O-sulfotransferase 5 [Elysia marginata]
MSVSAVKNAPLSSVLNTFSQPGFKKWKGRSPLNVINPFENLQLRQRMPKCLIVGFAKCGTYALKSFLSLHPNLICAENETQFFSRFYFKGFAWYKRQMPFSSEHQITVEKTPSYAESKLALQRIHAFNSSIKLIVIVRDPVTRLQSSYAHFLARNKDPKLNFTFREWCGDNESIIHKIDYYSHLVNIYGLFDRDQVLVLSEEDLEADPFGVMQQVARFVGLKTAFTKDVFVFNSRKGFYCINTNNSKYKDVTTHIKTDPITGCLKKSKGRSHPNVDKSFLRHLASIALPHNENLFHIINKRFPWTTVEYFETMNS